MKTRCAVILILATVLASCAPTIVLDKTYKGSHVILTSDTDLYGFDGGEFDVALGMKASAKDTLLAVLVTYDGDTKSGVFDKDDRIYFRLNDSTEFSIKNMYDREFESSTEVMTTESLHQEYGFGYAYSPYMNAFYVTPVSVTRWVPEVYTRRIHKSKGLYLITKKEFNDVVTKGVAYLKIESGAGDSEMPDPSSVAGTFKSEYEAIVDRLKGR